MIRRDRLIVAQASKVTPADFLAHVTGIPRLTEAEKAERWERTQAWRECEREMHKRAPDQFAHDDRCRARYAVRLAEIEAKYQPMVEVEHLGPGRIAA